MKLRFELNFFKLNFNSFGDFVLRLKSLCPSQRLPHREFGALFMDRVFSRDEMLLRRAEKELYRVLPTGTVWFTNLGRLWD